MTPCLIASASPARSCSTGSVASTLDVGDDGRRLMKRADEILARRRVDAGLSADRRVDHREQRRRHLHERNAAHERRRDEAGEVADDAAAERDDRRVAAEARGEQLVGEARPGLARLVRFAGGNREHAACATASSAARTRGAYSGPTLLVGDDRVAVRRRDLRDDVADALERAGGDGDVVRRQRDRRVRPCAVVTRSTSPRAAARGSRRARA